MMRTRRFWVFATVAMVLFGVGNYAMIHHTSSSHFCGSTCHVMESYYESWEGSVHEQEHVECVQCHIAPGFGNYAEAKINGMGQMVDCILGRLVMKPSASVSDFSCTREGCHVLSEVLDVVKEDGVFLFDHSKHLDTTEYLGINTHCTTCHSHVAQEEHFEINTNACISCHLLSDEPVAEYMQTSDAAEAHQAAGDDHQAEGEHDEAEVTPTRQCKKCHNAPAEPVEYRGLKVLHEDYLAYGAACESCHHNVTQRPLPVGDEQCFSCHDFGADEMADVEELHHEHSAGEHKVECFDCHGLISHGPIAEATAVEQFDCQSCHANQHAIQQETYKVVVVTDDATPLADLPVTPMFMAHVDCTGCHVKAMSLEVAPESDATVATASAEACDRCHKPGLGEQMIPMWQRDTQALYQSVETMLESVVPTDDRTRQLVAEAEALLKMIRVDGSWGVHNPPYTEALLKRAREKLAEAGATAPPEPEPTDEDDAPQSPAPADEPADGPAGEETDVTASPPASPAEAP